MLKNSIIKYRPFTSVQLPHQTWTSKAITHPLIWLSVALRDGNQALIKPINGTRKLCRFNWLVGIGFKEFFHRVSLRFTNRLRLRSLLN